MSVGFKVGSIIDEVGTQDFLHAFFSTISYHLEPNGWGSRFPELMYQLYQGQLDASEATKVLSDLQQIKAELKLLPPSRMIWDIEDLSRQPPWGKNISPDITDLSNYFVTSTGRDLFALLVECLTALKRSGGKLTVASY